MELFIKANTIIGNITEERKCDIGGPEKTSKASKWPRKTHKTPKNGPI